MAREAEEHVSHVVNALMFTVLSRITVTVKFHCYVVIWHCLVVGDGGVNGVITTSSQALAITIIDARAL